MTGLPYRPFLANLRQWWRIKRWVEEYLIPLVTGRRQQAEEARAYCLASGVRYLRLETTLETAVNMDEKDNGKLTELLFAAMCFMHKKRKIVARSRLS